MLGALLSSLNPLSAKVSRRPDGAPCTQLQEQLVLPVLAPPAALRARARPGGRRAHQAARRQRQVLRRHRRGPQARGTRPLLLGSKIRPPIGNADSFIG